MLHYLPVEYLSVSSQVKCILLMMTLSVLFTINCCSPSQLIHSAGDIEVELSAACCDGVNALKQVVNMLRLSLADSRAVHQLMSLVQSTSLLHCFSTLHFHIATKVSFHVFFVSALFIYPGLMLYEVIWPVWRLSLCCNVLVMFCMLHCISPV